MPIHVVSCSARDDFEEVIVFLLECGSEVNAQTENDGDTILHLIPRHNTIRLAFPAILKVLEYNPDVSIRNKVVLFTLHSKFLKKITSLKIYVPLYLFDWYDFPLIITNFKGGSRQFEKGGPEWIQRFWKEFQKIGGKVYYLDILANILFGISNMFNK